MKIAVCISGFLRTYDKSLHGYINNLFDPYDCDVFIHSPETPFALEQLDPVWNYAIVNKPVKILTTQELKEQIGERFVRDIKLYKYDPEPFHKHVKDYNLEPVNFLGQLTWRSISQYWNIKSVLQMKCDFELKNNFKYDIVVLTRSDLEFHTKFSFDQIDLNAINHPAGEGFAKDGVTRSFGAAGVFGTNRIFNDQILIGNSDNINVLMGVYDSVGKNHNELKMIINSETCIAFHLMNNNIKFTSCDFVTYRLLRA